MSPFSGVSPRHAGSTSLKGDHPPARRAGRPRSDPAVRLAPSDHLRWAGSPCDPVCHHHAPGHNTRSSGIFECTALSTDKRVNPQKFFVHPLVTHRLRTGNRSFAPIVTAHPAPFVARALTVAANHGTMATCDCPPFRLHHHDSVAHVLSTCAPSRPLGAALSFLRTFRISPSAHPGVAR